MKKYLIILLMLFLVGPIYSQVQREEFRQEITLCWHSDLDSNASYLVYYSLYGTDDTWNLMGSTKETTFKVQKQGFRGDIAFGVRSIYYDDTSSIHTTLDETACTTFGSQCDTTNCTRGPWYISWHVKKPSFLSIY